MTVKSIFCGSSTYFYTFFFFHQTNKNVPDLFTVISHLLCNSCHLPVTGFILLGRKSTSRDLRHTAFVLERPYSDVCVFCCIQWNSAQRFLLPYGPIHMFASALTNIYGNNSSFSLRQNDCSLLFA